MKRVTAWAVIGGMLGALLLTQVAAAEPLKIRYSIWVGYGPLFIAKEKGFFKEEKVDVDLVNIEDPKEGFFAMAAERLEGVVSTIDTMVLYLKTGKEYQYVLALDDSAGGDGIVARKEIKSIRDLKGKKVAVNEGSVSQFFLNVLLKEAGVSQKDLDIVNMKQGDAGAAFVAEKVDAAVTWEPWLSKGKAAPHGHILVDSSKTPGLITDVLIFRREVIQKRAKDIQGLVNAWNKAVAYWEKNPAEANEIMAKGVGDWLKDPKVFADVLTGVKFYDHQGNVKFFGTPQKPGDMYKVVQNALDIWASFGKLQAKGVKPRDLINHAFVK
ncbi:MAG: ABC transporter substrate-binding protein [Candidatus Rokubacteria bacterium]|nr:ABC transporter substrate-binding protein [Candidatus Rokubacteria bacterium]